MSAPFKPLSEQITGKMIADLKAGTSIFQRPNNNSNSALPFNIESGHRYAGPSALILLMQKRDDPRWGTSNQANRNHTAVVKGATGSLIQFMSNYEYQKMVDGDGQPVLKENGRQRTERIRLEEPKQVDAWLFNGEQMRNIEKWEKEPNILSPAERAQVILDNSKVVIENGGEDMFYDRQLDAIIIPEMEQFASPEQYYAEALHQLAHRTNAVEALDRPQAGNDPGGMISEELRTNLASLFLSKELNLPYSLNDHVGYVQSWSVMMKEDPAELFKAASDAQKIVDKILGFEQQIEEKQEVEQTQQSETEAGRVAETQIDTPKIDLTKLTEGEVIPHNGTEFKVVKAQKNNVYQMQDLGSERKFKMSSKDVLFNELLDARNNSQEVSSSRGISTDESAYYETEAVEQSLDDQYQIER
ncbi:zincin-like metallopeptidase domain-containing protein [Mucilaginibacter sp. RCC_168]|uniref:zincin-like metallopeptidase domain-containing protein n=1 Tax=Mucilaginibacter sp. RCC_168 TaxID=3239221 RepID=UPI003524B719